MTQPDYYLTDRRRIERFLEIVTSRNNYLNDHIMIFANASRFLSALTPDKDSDAIDPAVLAEVLRTLLGSHAKFLMPERLHLPKNSLPAMLVDAQHRFFELSADPTVETTLTVFDAILCLYDSLHAARHVFLNVLNTLRRVPLTERSVVSLSQQSDVAAALSVVEAATLMTVSVAHVQLRGVVAQSSDLAADAVAKLRHRAAGAKGRTCAMALHLLAPFVDRIESHGKGFVEAHLSIELERWVGAKRARSFGVNASLDEITHKEYAELSPYFRINKQVLVNDWNMQGIVPAMTCRGGVVRQRRERFYVQTKKMDRSIYLDGYRNIFEARNEYLRLPLRSGEHMAASSTASL